MSPYDEDVPTIKEIHRTMVDFREEWRNQMSQLVRKDVHTVEHEALLNRLARIESERDAQNKERATLRNQFYFAVLSAALSMTVALIVAAVK